MRIFVAVAAGYAVVLPGVFLAGRGTAGMRRGMDAASWHLAGAGFAYAPILLLAAALLALVDRHVSHASRPARRLALGATGAIVAVLVAANFDLTSERSLGLAWQPELEAARERCDAGRTTRASPWRRSRSASSSRRPAAICASTPPGRRARGVPAMSVAGGFEWTGLHYPHLAGEPAEAPACADPAT
jgi:hypothetical protein